MAARGGQPVKIVQVSVTGLDRLAVGRKTVLMIGLMGTMISALGFGFSKSFVTAMIFRSLGGALNGNVGVMRTVSLSPPSKLYTNCPR